MLKNLCYKKDVCLSKYHTYGIKAKAKYLVEVYNRKELIETIDYCKLQTLQFIVIGRGSNLLFKNNYYPGVVIVNKTKEIKIKNNTVYAESGASVQLLARRSVKNDLNGLQWLVGVPGSVGGAIFMNAGCEGFSTADFLTSVEVYSNGYVESYSKKDCNFSYRNSIFHQNDAIILSATFLLERDIRAKDSISIFHNHRKQTQPIDKKNCGCIFSNPKEMSAGKLIEECGLKGMKVNDAEVSTRHANFINNNGSASSNDIEKLIVSVQDRVKKEKGVKLHHEIRIV